MICLGNELLDKLTLGHVLCVSLEFKCLFKNYYAGILLGNSHKFQPEGLQYKLHINGKIYY